MKTAKKYKFTVVATDVAIFTINEGRLKVLLIKMNKKPYEKCWALPGGLVGPEESVDAAASRHLYKKTGLKKAYLDQFHTFGDVGRDVFGRVVSVAYLALLPSTNLKLETTSEYDDIGWFSVSKLPVLAYDHAEIVKKAIETIRQRLVSSNIAFSLLPSEFTLGQLQKVYEAILGERLDKRNFRKKYLSLGLIEETKQMTSGAAHRPAILYRFKK
ncbi:MAG: NUDIX domain-containing protein [Candidatus Paceibacterota bacterium]